MDNNAYAPGYMPVCADNECRGNMIWDAVADWQGNLITTFDNHECSDCGGSRMQWVKETDE